MIVERAEYLKSISLTLKRNSVCALLGPRQCGKTTLAREFGASRKSTHFFDLELPSDQARLSRPELTLSSLTGLIVIDEIQRMPELFTVLRPLADRNKSNTKFLILGSAAPDLIRGASESLAGRVGFVDMSGFNIGEIGENNWKNLWIKGGFPRSYLCRSNAASSKWRNNFIRTFLEQDIPSLGIRIPPLTLRRFWFMVAHYHAQIWNGSDLARSLSVSEHTVRHYLDILTGTFLIRQLQPWHENLSKRQYKSPKVYMRDSGILHTLLSISTHLELENHPKFGASWEGFALEQVLSIVGSHEAYFWGTHSGAELDLLLFRRGKRLGVEFKASDAPVMTKSLHVSLNDLKLDRAYIIYPGDQAYQVDEKVDVVPLKSVLEIFGKWK